LSPTNHQDEAAHCNEQGSAKESKSRDPEALSPNSSSPAMSEAFQKSTKNNKSKIYVLSPLLPEVAISYFCLNPI